MRKGVLPSENQPATEVAVLCPILPLSFSSLCCKTRAMGRVPRVDQLKVIPRVESLASWSMKFFLPLLPRVLTRKAPFSKISIYVPIRSSYICVHLPHGNCQSRVSTYLSIFYTDWYLSGRGERSTHIRSSMPEASSSLTWSPPFYLSFLQPIGSLGYLWANVSSTALASHLCFLSLVLPVFLALTVI